MTATFSERLAEEQQPPGQQRIRVRCQKPPLRLSTVPIGPFSAFRCRSVIREVDCHFGIISVFGGACKPAIVADGSHLQSDVSDFF
jgi:hypothetical protein